MNYAPDQWCFNSFSSAKLTGNDPPWPRCQEAILPSTDSIIYLQLRLSTGGWLVIPALEYFVRLYGVSNALRQILLTTRWEPEGLPKDRLYTPLKKPPQSGNWAIRLRRALDSEDEIFLAQAKYENFSTAAAKLPYAPLEAGHQQHGPDHPICIETGPWHQQPSNLAVEGMWFDSEKSFLGVRIVGSEDPKGPKIETDRENSNLFRKPAKGKDRGKAWLNFPINKGRKKSTLTGHQEPDHGTDNEAVRNPTVFKIGESRETERVIGEEAQSSAGPAPLMEAAKSEMRSTGDAYGTGKQVGRMSIHTMRLVRPAGIVISMWNAAHYLSNRHPDVIRKVEFCSSSRPVKTHLSINGLQSSDK